MTRREKERLSCAYCDGLGYVTPEYECSDGSEIPCPSCKEWPDEPADPAHHALRSEEMD